MTTSAPGLRALPIALFIAAAACLAHGSTPALAQRIASVASSIVDRELPIVDGPAAPVEPMTIRRDERGRATLRAVRLTSELRVDGRLDEEIYGRVPGAGQFIQQLPLEGAAATEPTEVWVFFDDENLYVAARCFDSQPDRIVADELRRDNRNVYSLNDNFTVVFDTFYDRRNGFFFQTSPIGAVRDQIVTDGGQNESWNTVWDVKAVRDSRGYTVEMVIPFKSLRYRGGGEQLWGINFRRIVRWKNEVSNLTLVPASYSAAGITQMSRAATLVGLVAPGQAMNLEVKPYALTSATTDRVGRPSDPNDIEPSVGLDAKYGLTKSLTADFTVNTDFAQVEEDLQQVNLTRFNLQFPEKRDFFLEGAGIFEFGGQSTQNSGDVPIMFFSRRIGLAGTQSVPVRGGGRLTGKAGKFDVGALAVETGEDSSGTVPSTTFTAVRIRRDILRRSSIGMIATGRWPSLSGSERNSTIGLDTMLRFFTNLEIGSYFARTSSPRLRGEDASYRGSLSYNGDRYGFGVEHLTLEKNFNPEVGFMRRSNFSGTTVSARFSPRLRRSRSIRRLSWSSELEYVTNGARTSLEDRTISGNFSVEFNSSDQISVGASQRHEVVPAAFLISSGVTLPRGDYSYSTVSGSYTLGQQRRLSGTLSGSRGSFYDGTRTALSYSGRLGFSARFAAEPTLTLNWVSLPAGDFTSRLLGARLVVTPTPRLGISGLVQFNAGSHSLTSSARLRWEYVPGSELFVVYSDGRDTAARGFPDVLNRTFVVKATRLLRF